MTGIKRGAIIAVLVLTLAAGAIGIAWSAGGDAGQQEIKVTSPAATYGGQLTPPGIR